MYQPLFYGNPETLRLVIPRLPQLLRCVNLPTETEFIAPLKRRSTYASTTMTTPYRIGDSLFEHHASRCAQGNNQDTRLAVAYFVLSCRTWPTYPKQVCNPKHCSRRGSPALRDKPRLNEVQMRTSGILRHFH